MDGIVCPIVHLNGTSKEELVNLRREFAHALRLAETKLAEMAPSGRDYYPKPGLMTDAVTQHNRRMDMLKKLYDEIVFEVEHLQDV